MAITEIQALHKVVQALAHIDDVHELLRSVVDSLAETLSADEVIFTGLDQDTHRVTQFARGGPCANTVGAGMVRYEALVAGPFERAIREMKPIFSTETALLPWADSTSRADRLESVARPMIVAPAIGHGRLLGLLTVVGRSEVLEAEPDFGPDDAELMATMASLCALAVEKERASEKAMIAAGREFPFFEKLDQINRTISKTDDLDTMLRDVLDVLLSVFECDRAWMAYPCEPDSPTWSVPMERTRPEYPGVLPLGIKMPLEPVGAAIYRILREAEGPVQFGPGGAHPMPDLVAQRFGVQSFIAMALYPKVDRPWAFGLHQCSNARIWSRDEERLFLEIGRRLSDGLTSLLTFRNLQKSQGELLQSNTLLWTIIEAAPTAIIALDLDGVVRTVWNTAAEKMLGWTSEEAIGQQLPSVPPSQWPQFQGFLASIRRGEGLNGVEVHRQKRDGSPIDYSIFASPLKDSDGQITGNIAVLVDVTDRKRAEAALRLYNERLSILREIDRAILGAQSTEKIARVVLEHMVRLIPCEWASIILHDEALTEETIFASQHMPDIQVSPVRTQPVVPNQVLERLKSGRTAIAPDLGLQEGPLAHLAADLLAQGVRAAMANPMMVQGRLIGTLALAARQVGFFTPEHQQIAEEIASQVAIAFYQAELNDKIARHNVELDQRVQERTALLEAANHDLELFSYSVSHDLRAPLRAIQGFSEIIFRRHRAALNDEGRRYFENIIVASSQMDRLITDLLAYSRLGRQRLPHMRPVSLDSVLSDVMIDLTAHILEADARIEIAQSLPSVDGDRTLLKQVFTNLIQNALTYHQQGVPPHIWVSSITEDEHVAIRVIDNGIGIPPEFRERIFGLFQRLHNQEEYPGTGIGLAVVRKAVEMMSGDVWVEAAPEQGSVFCVRLQRVADGGQP